MAKRTGLFKLWRFAKPVAWARYMVDIHGNIKA
jgi:hypothetical protein